MIQSTVQVVYAHMDHLVRPKVALKRSDAFVTFKTVAEYLKRSFEALKLLTTISSTPMRA